MSARIRFTIINTIIITDDMNKTVKKTYGELYNRTMQRKQELIDAGYKVIYIWESDFKQQQKDKLKELENAA